MPGTKLVTPPKAHLFGLISGGLFFVIVAGSILGVIADSDGGTSYVPFFLTLPWSIVTLKIPSVSAPVEAALLLFLGVINAIICYWIVRSSVKTAGSGAALAVLGPIAILVGGVVWFLNSQEHDARVRILNGEPESGVWLAIDSDGLRAMSGANRAASGVALELRNHFVFAPNQTRGIARGYRYLLPGGRLVDPYPANSYDLQRDNAIEVEKIRITGGPSKGVEGWAPTHACQRLLTIFAL